MDVGVARRRRRSLLGAFVAHQRRLRGAAHPLLDLALFRERAFSAGLATQLLLACAQASFFVYLALYLQQGRGLGPLEAGLVFTILAVAYVAASGPAPGLRSATGAPSSPLGGRVPRAGLGPARAGASAEIGVGGSRARARAGPRCSSAPASGCASRR